MFISLPELVTERVPEILQEDSTQDSGSQISSDRVLAALNVEYNELTTLAHGNDRPELLAWQDFGVGTDGTLDAIIPDKLGQIVIVTKALTNSPSTDEFHAVYNYRRTNRTQRNFEPLIYERYRDTVRIFNATAEIIRIWYMMNVPSLHYGAMGGGEIYADTDLWINRSPTVGRFDPTRNAYLHSRVHIYAGTGLDNIGRISAIDNTFPTPQYGRLATVTWTDLVSSSLLDETTRYALVPWLPIQFSELLAHGAALRFRKRTAAAMMQGDYARLRERFEEWLSSPDNSSPKPFLDAGFSNLGNGASGGI